MENEIIICISSEEEDCRGQGLPRKINKEQKATWTETKKFSKFAVGKQPINSVNIANASINQSSKTINANILNSRETITSNNCKREKSLNNVVKQQSGSVEKLISSNDTLNGCSKSESCINNKQNKLNISQSPVFKTGEVTILKRKHVENDDILIDKVVSTPVKRLKLPDKEKTMNNSVSPKASIEISPVKLNKNSSHPVAERNSPIPGCSWFPEVQKPKLIVKERKILYDDEFDLFSTFIETCLKRDGSDDMKEIVKKLKKRHKRLHPSFVNSPDFKDLLISKQKMISSREGRLFVHIQQVSDEMKNGAKESRSLEENALNAVDNDHSKKHLNKEKEKVEFRDKHEDRRIRKKLKAILNGIEVCKKRIKQLEEEEVDLNDEQDSSYLVEDRYNRKLMQLWAAYCKYSGEKVDAGRAYLRPKHISATSIPQVDQAVMSFINAKMSQRSELLAKGKSIADTVVFPDYVDILNCIAECNEKKNLGLSKAVQETKAKEAFIKIGEYLQRVRQLDYWDTFSLFLEEEDDDPALKDDTLAGKLNQNYIEGKKRMSNLFEDFTRKQKEKVIEQIENDDAASDEEDCEDNEDVEDLDENDKNNDNDEETDIEKKKAKKLTELKNVNEIENSKKLEDLNEKKEINENKVTSVNNTENVFVSTSQSVVKSMNDTSTHTVNVKNNALPQNKSSEATNSSLGVVDVIEIDEESSNVDKQPILRLASFAKTPTTWKDSSQSESSSAAKKFTTLTPKLSVAKGSPAFVDLTSEKLDASPIKTVRKTLDPATLAALKNKFKTVVIPSNFKGKQIISVKTITNNFNVVNGSGNTSLKPTRVVTSVSHKSPDGSQTIIRIPSQNPSPLKPRNLQMRVNKVPEKVLRKISEKAFSSNMPDTTKPTGSKQVYYKPTANPNIFTNPEGQFIRMKTIVPNPEAKVMKVLNLNDSQKISIAPLQKHRIANKVTLNQKPNQSNDQLNPNQVLANRIDHQYSKRIVNNVVRIMKPGEQNCQSINTGRIIKKV